MYGPIADFRKKLQDGQLLMGSGITLSDPQASEALADSVDFLWIELEHVGMSEEAVRGHLLAARSRNTPGIVRVCGNNASFIKPILDSGADGIIVPQVRSAEEVRQVVAECRYPPVGTRGVGPMIPMNFFRDNLTDHIEQANREVFVAVMIENVEALKEIDEIVALPGLDSVVIGPTDMSVSMGLPGEIGHPKVVAAYERIISAARTAGKFVGCGLGPDEEFAVLQARRGVQWLQLGGDCTYMIQCMDQLSSSIREKV